MGAEKSAKFKLKKTILIITVKFLLTSLAFYVISKKITFNPLSYLNQNSWDYFLLATLLSVLLIVIQTWRWSNVLQIFSTKLSFQQCFIAVWFGHLINHLVPTAAAGDLLRSYTLRQANGEHGKWRWLGAFFLEKYCAVISALFIACFSMLSSIGHELPGLLTAFILLLSLGLVMTPLIGMKISSYLKIKKLEQSMMHIQKLSILLLKAFQERRGQYALAFSFIINFGMCVVFYIIALGLGVHLKFEQCLFVVPVFTLLASLPISFAGWGIRELSCVGLLSFFGISSENAVIISVMYGLLFFLSSLPGVLMAYPFFSAMRNTTSEVAV